MAKTENQKLKTLYVAKYFLDHSDENHPAVTKDIVDYLKDHSKNKKRKYEWLTPERAAEFYAQPLVYLLIAWIKSGMHETPEEMLEMYQYVASHSMMDLPEDL